MTTSTLTMTARTLVASQSNAAGATKRGALDIRGKHGGLLTARIENGATGPTAACQMVVSHAVNDGSTPATGAIGADWRRMYTFAGTTTNSDVSEWTLDIPPCQHLQVEFSGNTGQAVTVEALFTEYSSVSSS
ncbi:MAG: hypothetical protein LT106_18610 [Burkholderiaceae bacterium]|nr:hypothetical protein [Burkholderiaceae bacterium]